MHEFNAELSLENSASLQLITDSLPVLVAYINQEFRYTFVNATYVQWLGKPRSEMIGRHLSEVQSPAIYEAVEPYIREALKGKKTHYQLKVPSRLGGYRYIEGIYTPDFGPHGEVRGVISHVADISEKKKIEEALQHNQDNDQFLAEASHLLSANLDLDQLLDSLGRLIVPRIADWFGVELLNKKGELETVTVLHQDPALIKLAMQMRKQFPSNPLSTTGPYGVLKSGQPELIDPINDQSIESLGHTSEYTRTLKALGLRSVILVPLRVRGESIGVLTLVHSESGRHFQACDVAFLQSLSYRAGLAIENAKLYAETKRQKDKLYALLMRAPIAISVRRGPHLIYELANEPYMKIVGNRQIMNRPILEVFPEIDPATIEEMQLCATQGVRFSESEYPLQLDWDGNGQPYEKILNLVYEPLMNDQGKPEGVISFAYEVTEQVLARRKVEETAEHFRVLSETIPHMVWTAQADGRTDYFNRRWYDYTGLDPSQPLHYHRGQLIHQEDLPRMREAWKHSVSTGEPYEIEFRLRSVHSSDYRWFMARALPIRDEQGRIQKWFGTSTEIQGQKELEENLIRARTGAEKASLAKSNFLANMSHEIRTPMTAVLGFTEILRDQTLPEECKSDYVARIEKSGRSLLRLIDDILDISKIEAGQFHVEKDVFSPLEILSEVISMLKYQASNKNVRMQVKLGSKLPGKMISDAARIRQILVNLIGNAVKFTAQGEIIVVIRFEKQKDQCFLSFEVRDTGIGISSDDQPKLFSAFVQADDSITRTFGGSGLGLALSRRLAEKLGGSLELVESTPGIGSVFRAQVSCEVDPESEWIDPDIPLVTTEISGTPSPSTRAKKSQSSLDLQLKGISVLLAEDVPDNRALIKTFLESAGASVELVENGKQAIESVRTREFDVVLMDLQMPIMDGIQATKILRQQGYSRPILALSAHAMKEEKDSSLAAGCTDHVTKPIGRRDLVTQILKYLS